MTRQYNEPDYRQIYRSYSYQELVDTGSNLIRERHNPNKKLTARRAKQINQQLEVIYRLMADMNKNNVVYGVFNR